MCGVMGYFGNTLTKEDLKPFFDRTVSRGPDMQRFVTTEGAVFGFERLSIMGLSEEGMQPFEHKGNYVVCNGEIYGFRDFKLELASKHDFQTDSDCETILPLYHSYGMAVLPCAFWTGAKS